MRTVGIILGILFVIYIIAVIFHSATHRRRKDDEENVTPKIKAAFSLIGFVVGVIWDFF